MSRKHCGKKRICSLQAISPFPTVFSEDLHCRHVKAGTCFGKDLNIQSWVIYQSFKLDFSVPWPWINKMKTLERGILRTVILCLTLYQNDNFLDLTKFKAFADDKWNVAKIIIYVFDRVQNIVGKGENAGYPQSFQKASFSGLWKVGIVWKELNVESVENIKGKGENASYYHSHGIFKTLTFSTNLKLSSANYFSLEESKFCGLVNT